MSIALGIFFIVLSAFFQNEAISTYFADITEATKVMQVLKVGATLALLILAAGSIVVAAGFLL